MNNFQKFNNNLSNLQSLDDLGFDEEEKNSILYQATSSLNQKELKVNWRSFEDHIHFGSAYWAVNFAINRIYNEENGYPWDGSLSQKNEWRLSNTAFENWWFDNEYPHQFGYANIASGSFISFYDHESSANIISGSFTVEFVLKAFEDSDFNAIFSNYTSSFGIYCFLSKSTSQKTLVFGRDSGSIQRVSVSYDQFVSSSHRVSLVFDSNSQLGQVYIDGDIKASSSFSIPSFSRLVPEWTVGRLVSGSNVFYFTGSIDDFRVYQTARSPQILKRNYAKSVDANHSAALKIYYKFNEVNELPNQQLIVDYSGYGNHGQSNGSVTKISGTLGSWFKTIGDPILNQSNSRVSSSIESWLLSGSLYDKINQSYIFNIVPQFLIEEEENIDTQLFLLLVARHYDRLKLYSKHLGYMLYSNESEYNVAPDDFLNLLSENYGFDIGSIYEGADPVEYFFGENIFTSSFSEPLQKIRNQIRRNLVNNLIYILKTKSTRESVESSLRSLALPVDVLNINEYSILPNGKRTTYSPKTVERRVLNFSSSTIVSVHSASFFPNNFWQISVALNSSSTSLTSSIFSVYSGSSKVFELKSQRENVSSSLGKVVFEYINAASSSVSSSLLKIYDNLFFTVLANKNSGSGTYQLHVGKVLNQDLEFFDSSSVGLLDGGVTTFSQNFTGTLGTSGSSFFEGRMFGFQSWNTNINSSSVLMRRAKDFDSLTAEDFLTNKDNLKIYYKLNDFTSSAQIKIHDYSGNENHGSASFLISGAAEDIFRGDFIEKLEPSYSYDIGINNDKIQIFSGSSKVNKVEESFDLPFVSVDIGPVASLNKEIVKWIGDLEKFDNLVGKVYDKYKFEITDLNEYSNSFFEEKLTSKVKFKSYLNLIKWFDSNFVNLFSQLIPIDLISSISSFAVESHILEHNKVEYPFPIVDKIGNSKTIETSITTIMPLTAGAGINLDLADPGRFGSPVSASSEILDANFVYPESSSSGLSFKNYFERKFLTETYAKNSGSEFGDNHYSNGFYSKVIEDELHLINTYGIVSGTFDISKTPYFGGSGFEPGYLTSAYGAPTNTFFSQSASLNFIQDQRWLYAQKTSNTSDFARSRTTMVSKGLKFGGGFGQLPFLANRKLNSNVFFDNSTQVILKNPDNNFLTPFTDRPIEYIEKSQDSFTEILWPYKDSIFGTRILAGVNDDQPYGVFAENERRAGANVLHLGEAVNVEGYKYMSVDIYANLNIVHVYRNYLRLLVKFAFSADETEPSFETFPSSSIRVESPAGPLSTLVDTLEQRQIEKYYKFNEFGDFTSGSFKLNYSWNISRNIPSAKLMKMYMEVELNTPETTITILRPAGIFLVKGTFYKESRDE